MAGEERRILDLHNQLAVGAEERNIHGAEASCPGVVWGGSALNSNWSSGVGVEVHGAQPRKEDAFSYTGLYAQELGVLLTE